MNKVENIRISYIPSDHALIVNNMDKLSSHVSSGDPSLNEGNVFYELAKILSPIDTDIEYQMTFRTFKTTEDYRQASVDQTKWEMGRVEDIRIGFVPSEPSIIVNEIGTVSHGLSGDPRVNEKNVLSEVAFMLRRFDPDIKYQMIFKSFKTFKSFKDHEMADEWSKDHEFYRQYRASIVA